MNKIIALLLFVALFSCTDNTAMQPYDKAQKPAEVNVKGYSKPDALQLRLNGVPVSINGNTSYTDKIETQINFVLDEGETDELGIYSTATGVQIAKYNITYDNVNTYNLSSIKKRASTDLILQFHILGMAFWAGNYKQLFLQQDWS